MREDKNTDGNSLSPEYINYLISKRRDDQLEDVLGDTEDYVSTNDISRLDRFVESYGL